LRIIPNKEQTGSKLKTARAAPEGAWIPFLFSAKGSLVTLNRRRPTDDKWLITTLIPPARHPSEIHALGIDLYLHQQEIDTTTPAAKTMVQMMCVFAEFERAMIQERVPAGLSRPRHKAPGRGIRSSVRTKVEAATKTAIRTALVKGDHGMRKANTATLAEPRSAVNRVPT
jgi:hypothetical protein